MIDIPEIPDQPDQERNPSPEMELNPADKGERAEPNESGQEKISRTRNWVSEQYGKLAELIRQDVKLNEEMFDKLGPQIEDNRREVIKQKHEVILNLLARTEDAEKYYDEKLEELERLSALKVEDFKYVKPDQFEALPEMDKRVLQGEGLIREQIKNTDDPELLTGWYLVGRNYNMRYTDMVEKKMQAMANESQGNTSNEPWDLMQYEPYAKYKWLTGNQEERTQILYSDEVNGRMDKAKAEEYFEQSFTDGLYNGNVEILGSYLRNVPPGERNSALLRKAEKDLVQNYWNTRNGNEGFAELVDQLNDPDSSASRSLQALWGGRTDITPFSAEYRMKNERLIEFMREILASPERKGNFLDYFVKQCGIKNIDRFSINMLDQIYKEKDDTEKPYGLMILPTADYNTAFQRRTQFEELYDSVKQSGSRLLLAEAENDREVLKSIKNAVTRQNGNKIGFMIIGGHGTPDTIQFGAHEKVHNANPQLNSEIEKDNDTHIRMTIRASRKYIEPQAEVLAIACSTGAKTEKSTYPITEAVARRTGLITKGMSKSLSFRSIFAHLKPDGRIGLDMQVLDNPRRNRGGNKLRTPAQLNTFKYEKFNPEEYDYLARSEKSDTK